MARVNVYVDGLNLYNGALRGTPYRWIDLQKLSQALLKPGDEIQRIRYFTALLDGAANSTVRQQQETYIRALRTIPSLTVHLGLFVAHKRAMPRANGSGTVEVLRTDEKGSDVNLASHLLLDAGADDFEKALVVSNDNDFAFPVRAVRDRLGITIGVSCPVALPGRRAARLLVDAASFTTHLTRKRRKLLRQSQFPNPVIDPPVAPSTNPAAGKHTAPPPNLHPPPSLPALPATQSTHALIALLALLASPAPAITGAASPLTSHASPLPPSFAPASPPPPEILAAGSQPPPTAASIHPPRLPRPIVHHLPVARTPTPAPPPTPGPLPPSISESPPKCVNHVPERL